MTGATWALVIVTSLGCYALKLLGYVIPESWLANPRFQRINALVPIALLSALVATQTFLVKTKLVIDHRSAAVVAALVALMLRWPFLAVVVAGGVASALVYRWH
jgi:uncharacterized membrane protein